MKGQYKGNCNRTDCQKQGAIWYNHSTRKHYCEECANLINYHNHADAMTMFGHELCTLVEEEYVPSLIMGEFFDNHKYIIDNLYPQKQSNHKEVPVRTEPKIGRNDPCSCGSGFKYKKCCLK